MKKVSVFFAALFLLATFFYLRSPMPEKQQWGINFSITHAAYLEPDWPRMYVEILDELRPEILRIMAYWEIIEPERGRFEFEPIDYLLREAGRRGIEVSLVLGHKQPRWPECHHPAWYDALSSEEQREALLEMLEQAVSHFRQSANITAWQVENEPFFKFGPRCGTIPRDLFEQELTLVKTLDGRPILVTDSGEKGAWLPTALAGGDIFGSTMYRTIYHHEKEKYITYPIPPLLYRIKAGAVRTFTRIERFEGVELQAEPWFASDVWQTPLEEQSALMNPEILARHIEYARKVGFERNYLWGAEWWWWMKKNNHSDIWEAAKNHLNK